MNVNIIAAVDDNMGIGINGHLPWKLNGDITFFKKITLTTIDPTKQNAVIMGRKTWESIPIKFKPLPKRLNIIRH